MSVELVNWNLALTIFRPEWGTPLAGCQSVTLYCTFTHLHLRSHLWTVKSQWNSKTEAQRNGWIGILTKADIFFFIRFWNRSVDVSLSSLSVIKFDQHILMCQMYSGKISSLWTLNSLTQLMLLRHTYLKRRAPHCWGWLKIKAECWRHTGTSIIYDAGKHYQMRDSNMWWT